MFPVPLGTGDAVVETGRFLWEPSFCSIGKLRPVEQKSSRVAHYAHKEDGCCRNRATAQESGKPDSLLFHGKSHPADKSPEIRMSFSCKQEKTVIL